MWNDWTSRHGPHKFKSVNGAAQKHTSIVCRVSSGAQTKLDRKFFLFVSSFHGFSVHLIFRMGSLCKHHAPHSLISFWYNFERVRARTCNGQTSWSINYKLYRTNAPARSIFLASHEWGFFHFGHKNRLKFLCGLEPPLPSIVSTLRLVFPERRCLGQFDSVEMEWMQKYTGNGVN